MLENERPVKSPQVRTKSFQFKNAGGTISRGDPSTNFPCRNSNLFLAPGKKRLPEFNKRCKKTVVKVSNILTTSFPVFIRKKSQKSLRSGGNPVTFSSMALLHLITSGRLAEHIRNISQQLSHWETTKM